MDRRTTRPAPAGPTGFLRLPRHATNVGRRGRFMSTLAAERVEGRRRRHQVGLGDLVLAVGVALLARATCISLRLALDATRPGSERGGGAFGVAWRLAGAAFLAWMALRMSGLARDDSSPLVTPVFWRPQWQIKLTALGLA